MATYIYNSNTDSKGKHEVHTLSCTKKPYESNRILIGSFSSCNQAIQHAKAITGKTNFDGCYYCCNECHTG